MDRSKTNPQALQKTIHRFLVLPSLGFFAFALVGCATYQTKVDEARRAMSSGSGEEAVTKLEPLAKKAGDDQLVYLLDYATALQQAGKFKESAQAFGEADRLVDLKDYHSVSKITGSLLFNEGMVQYKGDDYEKLLINTMAAIDYLMLGDREAALVEARRLNEKLEYYRLEEKKSYEQNPFVLYLTAMMWEADKNYDAAYIDYERVHKAAPDTPGLKEDLVRVSKKAQRPDKFEKWTKEFGLKMKPEWQNKNLAEIILVFQQGWGPRKYPHPESPRFPKLYPTVTYTKFAKFEVAGAESVLSQPIYSVQNIAIKTLDDAYAALVAKRVAGIAAKEVVAHQVEKNNEALGAVMRIAMYASDQADLRQWSTLPETFQVARLWVQPGKHMVSAKGMIDATHESGEDMAPREITVKAGQKAFVAWRSFK